MILSIIIPFYNEERTLSKVLTKLKNLNLENIRSEIILVDDGSTDKTLLTIKKPQDYKIIKHKKNLGKGAAIRSALKVAKGDLVLIQDADLEYDPSQIKNLLAGLRESKAEIVYGTRLKRWPNFKSDERTFRFFIHYMGNRVLSLIMSVLYGHYLTDMETGYKLFAKSKLKGIEINAKGFEFEPEITAKFLKKGYDIHEVKIKTTPRSYNEGKKLRTFKDGTKAVWTIIKYRFMN